MTDLRRDFLKCSACGLTYPKYTGHTCDWRMIQNYRHTSTETKLLRFTIALLGLVLMVCGWILVWLSAH